MENPSPTITLRSQCITYYYFPPAQSPTHSFPLSVLSPYIVFFLSSLLSEDFLKLKGSLFFRLAATVADPDDAVASLGTLL